MGKTFKDGYTGTKRWDKSCRNHGECNWCHGNRTINNKKRTGDGFKRRQKSRSDLLDLDNS